jgi:hypothetical protein
MHSLKVGIAGMEFRQAFQSGRHWYMRQGLLAFIACQAGITDSYGRQALLVYRLALQASIACISASLCRHFRQHCRQVFWQTLQAGVAGRHCRKALQEM